MGERAPPPEDEFDVFYREAWAVPGLFFVLWVATVRSWRWLKRSVSR